MITDILEKLIHKKDLCASDVERAIAFILEGDNAVQAGAFLSLLSAKGISHQELEGCVHTFQKRMTSVDIKTPVLDIVGTGGDGMNIDFTLRASDNTLLAYKSEPQVATPIGILTSDLRGTCTHSHTATHSPHASSMLYSTAPT